MILNLPKVIVSIHSFLLPSEQEMVLLPTAPLPAARCPVAHLPAPQPCTPPSDPSSALPRCHLHLLTPIMPQRPSAKATGTLCHQSVTSQDFLLHLAPPPLPGSLPYPASQLCSWAIPPPLLPPPPSHSPACQRCGSVPQALPSSPHGTHPAWLSMHTLKSPRPPRPQFRVGVSGPRLPVPTATLCWHLHSVGPPTQLVQHET